MSNAPANCRAPQGAAVLLLAALAAAPCWAQQKILWKDPGRIEDIDFSRAAGIAPSPQSPYRFLAEQSGGTSPKILAQDAAGVKWRIKGGLETKSENFATRLAAAMGYFADPVWFVERGGVLGAGPLKRAAGFIRPDGSFSNASFELRDPSLRPLAQDWMWNDNPFRGSRELNGLKILMMLLSNWDNKDARDRWSGSNTGVAERRSGGRLELIYRVTDWGQTLGAWGPEAKPKNWNCAAYTSQSASFVLGRNGAAVRFGFEGVHTGDFKSDITVDDVKWLLHFLGRISDGQLTSALRASGATQEETGCFSSQIRRRIAQLQQITE